MVMWFYVWEHLKAQPTVDNYIVCGRVPWLYQHCPGGFMVFVVLCPGTPEGSTGCGSGFKMSRKTGQRFKVSSNRLGEAGNRTCDPWFTRNRFIPYTTAAVDNYMIRYNVRSFYMFSVHDTVKPVLSGNSKRRRKLVFKSKYHLMQVKSIAECSKRSILQYFRPSLSYHLS